MIKYCLITLLVVFSDQISKYCIKSSFNINNSKDIIGSFLRFSYVENSGLVFGIPASSILYYTVVLLSIFIIFYIYHFEMKQAIKDLPVSKLKLVSCALILGGAIGNVIDRFFVIFRLFEYKGVVDFISVGIGEYIRFPYIFNLADTSVTIGIILYIYYNYIQNTDLINAEAEKI